MIARVWHGWTTPGNANAYERLLTGEVFPAIAARGVPGYRAIELFRREADGEVEFETVMWFEDLDAVRRFAGEDYEAAYVPPAARSLLARFDARSRHYQVRARLEYPPAGEAG